MTASAPKDPHPTPERPRRGVFHDETGARSAARTFLALWLANAALYVWIRDESDGLGVVLTFFTAIGSALVVWAAGPRIAQYLGPAVAGSVQGVADAARALAAKVRARRDPDAGYEVTR